MLWKCIIDQQKLVHNSYVEWRIKQFFYFFIFTNKNVYTAYMGRNVNVAQCQKHVNSIGRHGDASIMLAGHISSALSWLDKEKAGVKYTVIIKESC